MDGVYYDEVKRLLTEFGDLESANARDSAVRWLSSVGLIRGWSAAYRLLTARCV